MVLKEGSYIKDIIIVILVLTLALTLIYYIGIINKPTIIYLTNQTTVIEQTNTINNQTTLIQNNSFTVPLLPEKEYYQYDVSLLVTPSKICVGEDATGRITSNIKSGICSIFANTGTGFKVYKNIILNINGYYSETNQMNSVGSITFRAVCCDLNKNCKISNDDTLTVEQCQQNPDSDGDGIPDETDPDDDNDGYLDEEEIEEGTDPLDPNSHPEDGEEMDCNSFCITKDYASGRGTFDSIGYCNYPEVAVLQSLSPNEYCCCMPFTDDGDQGVQAFCSDTDSAYAYPENLKYQGTCTDATGSYTDVCEANNIKEYYCAPTSNPDHCDYVTYNCPNNIAGSSCSDGKCVLPSCDILCQGRGYYTGISSSGGTCTAPYFYDSATQCCCKWMENHHGCEHECSDAGMHYLFCYTELAPGLCPSNNGVHLPAGDGIYGCGADYLECCCR